jgi:hypothetical protein
MSSMIQTAKEGIDFEDWVIVVFFEQPIIK